MAADDGQADVAHGRSEEQFRLMMEQLRRPLTVREGLAVVDDAATLNGWSRFHGKTMIHARRKLRALRARDGPDSLVDPDLAATLRYLETRAAHLRERTLMRERALAQRDWASYFGLPEKFERLAWLEDAAPSMPDAAYWRQIAEEWTYVEQIYGDQRRWLRLLKAERPQREHLMTAEEHTKLAALPDRLEVYRGVAGEQANSGVSWTLGYKRAAWFARRSALVSGRPRVVVGLLRRERILAVFLGRGEDEILADPRSVRVQRIDVIEASAADH